MSPEPTRTITSTTVCSSEVVRPDSPWEKHVQTSPGEGEVQTPNTTTSRVPSAIYSAYLFCVATFSYGMVWVCNQLTIETRFVWHVHFVTSDPADSVQTKPSTKLHSYAILPTTWSTSFPYQVLSRQNAWVSGEQTETWLGRSPKFEDEFVTGYLLHCSWVSAILASQPL